LFYADESGVTVSNYIILHMICECIKWTVAEIVESKEPKSLLPAMTMRWIKLFGAPDVLIWDGEGAMNSDEAKVWADKWNIGLIIRPKEKKAWIAERHHEILRVQLHKTQSQLAIEDIKVPFNCILAEAVLAKNMLLSTGQGSPYMSLYGRLPKLLPQIEDVTGASRLSDDVSHEGQMHIKRCREVSVGSAIKAMAEYRATMAHKSRTPLTGEQLDLKNGDDVEIYRQPPTKDRPGWVGPAKVTDISELDHGRVTVRWQGRHATVSLESLRRAMTYFTFVHGFYGAIAWDGMDAAWTTLREAVCQISNRCVSLGKV
jgi:hypothetical protein